VVHKFMSPGAEHELIASIMVAALFFGPNETALNEFGYDSGTVRVVAARMRDSQMWTDDVVDYQDWYSADERRGVVNFHVDLGVARGLLRWNGTYRKGARLFESLIYEGKK
jgi:hypothetical protein